MPRGFIAAVRHGTVGFRGLRGVPLMAVVRYPVGDVAVAEAFYVERLGFVVEQEVIARPTTCSPAGQAVNARRARKHGLGRR